MEVRRTVPIKLDVADRDADLLRETIRQFLDAANYVVDTAYDGEWVEIRKSVLHHETYSEVRARTELHSNHVQSARDRAVDALKSTVAKWQRGKEASSGNELDHWRREYETRRASMQQRGTRYAHEAMQRVGESERGRFDQMLHCLANKLVDEADEHGCSHIAFEDLTDIRERMPGAKRLHAWAFRRLLEYVEYKAEERSILVEQVDPANTSRRCSSCGHTATNNRPSQDTFACQRCGYENHADYNAAKNVGYRLLRNQTGSGGGAPVGVRLNTGMLNANGVSAVPNSGRAGVHGESLPL